MTSERRQNEPTGWLLSVFVCCSHSGGRVVGCIMQEAGDEPSQEGVWVEMRHSMTSFRRVCIIQYRSSNLFSCLNYCRVSTAENIWKIRLFPTGESVQLSSVLLQLPHSCPKILASITTTHPESCILPRLLPPQILPCHPILLNSPLLAAGNELMLAMVQSHTAADARSQGSGSSLFIKPVK